MEQVPPRSESATQEQQEKYPNDWPVITPEQERIKLGLPAVPPMPEAPAETPKPPAKNPKRVRKLFIGAAIGLRRVRKEDHVKRLMMAALAAVTAFTTLFIVAGAATPAAAAAGNGDSYAGRGALNTTASSSSVVGLWHLDETSGTTAFDGSGNGNNGAISGPVTLGVPGHLNTAYSFVPKSTVIVPNASDLVPGTATITISYWLKATTLPCCNAIDYDMFTKGDGSSKGGQIKIEVQGNGQASCMFRGSLGKKQLQAGPNVVDGQWHQVTCVRNGTQIVETVDGASFSVTKATGAITVTDTIRLGSHKGGGDWYKGVLDEVTYSIGS